METLGLTSTKVSVHCLRDNVCYHIDAVVAVIGAYDDITAKDFLDIQVKVCKARGCGIQFHHLSL